MIDLKKITINVAPYYQQRALMRLQLAMNAEVHRLFSLYQTQADEAFNQHANTRGLLEENDADPLKARLLPLWDATWSEIVRIFQNARGAASALPFGGLVRYHERYVVDQMPKQENILSLHQARIAEETANRLFGGINLSQRIWRSGVQANQTISTTIDSVVSGGITPVEASIALEGVLGHNAECPRWTMDRLFQLTPSQRATRKKGLLSGNPCASKGIAYNALRLIRNEIQIIYHAANDDVLAAMPWVFKERIVLSPFHPPIGCVCETVAAGGEDGRGIYEVGTYTLPLHVQCYCLKIAVTQSQADFAKDLRAWLNYEQNDDINRYASYIGADRTNIGTINLATFIAPLLFWLSEGAGGLYAELRGTNE